MINFRKALTASLVAATLGLSLAASSTPAAAWGYYNNGWGWGLGGVAAGLALGAAAATAASPYYGYGYANCGIVRQPVVDGYGNFIRYRRVRVCN
jgi:hypothetical protein